MGDNPLNNIPSQGSLLASINAIYGALRGAFVPRDAAGVVGAGSADLGSTTVPWDSAYINALIVGGAAVDVAALANSAPIYPFRASDSSFSWPGGQSRALILLWGSAGGGGGGGGGGVSSSDGDKGGDGAATTVTIGGVTYSSGASPGGRGGAAGAQIAQGGQGRRDALTLAIPGGAAGVGGAASGGQRHGEGGTSGSCILRYFIHTGLSQGDSLAVSVATANGDGGAGGPAGGSGNAGTDGTAGTSPGLAILLALP